MVTIACSALDLEPTPQVCASPAVVMAIAVEYGRQIVYFPLCEVHSQGVTNTRPLPEVG